MQCITNDQKDASVHRRKVVYKLQPCLFFPCGEVNTEQFLSKESLQSQRSSRRFRSSSSSGTEMEAIKKKMQAMKVEKDNACDRVDVCEEQCKAARVSLRK